MTYLGNPLLWFSKWYALATTNIVRPRAMSPFVWVFSQITQVLVEFARPCPMPMFPSKFAHATTHACRPSLMMSFVYWTFLPDIHMTHLMCGPLGAFNSVSWILTLRSQYISYSLLHMYEVRNISLQNNTYQWLHFITYIISF